MHVAMAFMVQRMETAAKTDEIMARFRPIAPKPPSAGATKRSRPEDDYQILPPSQLPAPVWWPAGVGSVAWDRKGKGLEPSYKIPPLPSVPSSDEHLVRLSLAQPGAETAAIPVEHDMLSRLQQAPTSKVVVFRPRPARPLRTTICIDSSNIVVAGVESPPSKKTAKQVEAQAEKDAYPVVVSGGLDRVFLVNEAYKEMVGQPVCPWLESLPAVGKSRRISGEVVLKVKAFSAASSSSSRLPTSVCDDSAFPCTARISWELGDGTIASLTVPCAVERLTGDDSGNYRSIWRFDSTRTSIIYCLA